MIPFIFESTEYDNIHEFALNEIFSIKKSKFGTNSPNFDNDKILEIDNKIYTFFHSKGFTYIIYLMDNGYSNEIGFASKQGINDNPLEYDDIRTNQGNPLKVFNNVLFVLSKLIKHKKPQQIYFNPRDVQLGLFYSKLVKNNNVKDIIKSLGYSYESDGLFVRTNFKQFVENKSNKYIITYREGHLKKPIICDIIVESSDRNSARINANKEYIIGIKGIK